MIAASVTLFFNSFSIKLTAYSQIMHIVPIKIIIISIKLIKNLFISIPSAWGTTDLAGTTCLLLSDAVHNVINLQRVAGFFF